MLLTYGDLGEVPSEIHIFYEQAYEYHHAPAVSALSRTLPDRREIGGGARSGGRTTFLASFYFSVSLAGSFQENPPPGGFSVPDFRAP
jgi:hypothetical protein